ncbi:MAG: ribokinase [Sedimentisphaerales bacterium]|nr:ribokinase [Sedimentisphaerales bacterium]
MSGRNPKIVVVGSAYVDLAAKCSQVPMAGETSSGTALSFTPTGQGLNQAIEAALCGCEVHLVSKIGNCPFGLFIKSILQQYYNVKTDYLFTATAKNTGVILTLVDTKGENACVRYEGANIALVPQDIDAAEQAFAEADICLIHARLPKEVVIKAIATAKLHGKKVILDPAGTLGQPGSEPGVSELPAEYFSVDVLIPNLYEAGMISERSTANIRTAKLVGSDLVARGAGAAVITMGKRGCMVVDRTSADHIPAYEIELVDHTGTGDAFAGALAASLAVGDDLRKAVKFASAAGAIACTKFGSVDAMPAKAEIIELLQKQEPE